MTKIFDVISHDGYLYIIDRDIKVGDICRFKHPLQNDFKPEEKHSITNLRHSDYKPYEVRTNNGYGPKEAYFKLIASNNLFLKDIPQFEIEEDIELLARNAFMERGLNALTEMDKILWIGGWENCYKSASKKQYTEEDLRKAFYNGGDYKTEDEWDTYFNSLNIPKQVELEMDFEYYDLPDQQQWQEMNQKEKMAYASPTNPKIENRKVFVKSLIY